MDRGQVVLYFAQKLVLEICFSDLSSPDFQTGHQELGIILKDKRLNLLQCQKRIDIYYVNKFVKESQ